MLHACGRCGHDKTNHFIEVEKLFTFRPLNNKGHNIGIITSSQWWSDSLKSILIADFINLLLIKFYFFF